MIHFSEREYFLHLKFIDMFFIGNTILLRKKRIEHHGRAFCLFLPHSTQRKDEKEWHHVRAMHRELRKGRQKISPSWREKACEDGDELCRHEDASMDFGAFTDFEHTHAFLLLCSLPTALHHSLLFPHTLHQPETLRKTLTLHPLSLPFLEVILPQKNVSEGFLWTAGSLARKVCPPEGKELPRCIAGRFWISKHQTAMVGCSLASWTS